NIASCPPSLAHASSMISPRKVVSFAAARPGASNRDAPIQITSFFIFFSFGLSYFWKSFSGRCCVAPRDVSKQPSPARNNGAGSRIEALRWRRVVRQRHDKLMNKEPFLREELLPTEFTSQKPIEVKKANKSILFSIILIISRYNLSLINE